jgi:hypothetical protein
MSVLDDMSADLMPCVFNLGALNPALAAILSTRPARELDLCSENESKSVNLSRERLLCVPLLFTLVFPDTIGSGGPRKRSSVVLLEGGSESGRDPISSPNIEEKKVLVFGVGGTQSPITAALSSIPSITKFEGWNSLKHSSKPFSPFVVK